MNNIPTPDIIESKLLAKAVFEYNGKIHILAVFERSDYYRFFHLFTARTARTPRKNWKYTKQYFGLYGTGGLGKIAMSIEEYLKNSIYRDCSFKVIYPRPIKKKDYLIWHRRIALPLENRQPATPAPGQNFKYTSAVTSGNREDIARYRKNALRSN